MSQRVIWRRILDRTIGIGGEGGGICKRSRKKPRKKAHIIRYPKTRKQWVAFHIFIHWFCVYRINLLNVCTRIFSPYAFYCMCRLVRAYDSWLSSLPGSENTGCDLWCLERITHESRPKNCFQFFLSGYRTSDIWTSANHSSPKYWVGTEWFRNYYCYYLLFKAELELDFTQLIGFLTRGNLIITCLKLIFKPWNVRWKNKNQKGDLNDCKRQQKSKTRRWKTSHKVTQAKEK